MIALEVLAFVAGAALVWIVVSSAIRTVIVPRGEVVIVTRAVFLAVRRIFTIFANDAHSYEQRDRVMARYAPTALMLLPIVWAAGVLVGFAAIYWAIDGSGWSVFLLSGSSLTTLGFERADHDVVMIVSVLEALIGLGLIALLISFLPTIYGHFSRRETLVGKLYIRAGDADGTARPEALIIRSHRIGGLERMGELWPEWEQWFVEVGEAHTSFPALVFFRSPSPRRSWVTASGIALDSAAIMLSSVDTAYDPHAAIMIRSGYEALRDIADYYGIAYDPDPAPDDPITVTRDEFLAVYRRLDESGVPVHPDRDAAWLAYRGWRVNYDEVVVKLAALTMAPFAPWISDRSVAFPRPPLRGVRRAHIR